jgi:TonB family protein
LSFIIVLAYMNTQAQNVSPDDQVFTIVQQQPKFPGNVNDWLAQNIVYPEYAKNNNIHGTVFVGFVVEKDGSVSNVTIKQGVQSSIDQEALRVISLMPRWSPGMQNGQAVRVQYMVPIRFMLNDQPATNNQPIKDNNEVYNTVQQMPKFPGEVDAWLASNIVYPSDAKSRGVYGTVYISFIIEKNGAISNPIIYKGVEGGESLNKEALRVVSMMPNWTPGNQNGMAVRVKEMLPVAFMPQSEHHYSNNNGSGKQSVADPYGNTIQVDQKPEYHGNLLSFLAANLR